MLQRARRAAALFLACASMAMAAGPGIAATQERDEALRTLRQDAGTLPPDGIVRLVTLLMEASAAEADPARGLELRREALKHFRNGMARGSFERLDLLHALARTTPIPGFSEGAANSYSVMVYAGLDDYMKSKPPYAALRQRCEGFEGQLEQRPELVQRLLQDCIFSAGYVPAAPALERLAQLPGTPPDVAAKYQVLVHADPYNPASPFDYRERVRNLSTIILALRGPGLKVSPRQPWDRHLSDTCYQQQKQQPTPAADFEEKCQADAAVKFRALKVEEVFPQWKYLSPREKARVASNFSADRLGAIQAALEAARIAEVRCIKAPYFRKLEEAEERRLEAEHRATLQKYERWRAEADEEHKRETARFWREMRDAVDDGGRRAQQMMPGGGGRTAAPLPIVEEEDARGAAASGATESPNASSDPSGSAKPSGGTAGASGTSKTATGGRTSGSAGMVSSGKSDTGNAGTARKPGTSQPLTLTRIEESRPDPAEVRRQEAADRKARADQEEQRRLQAAQDKADREAAAARDRANCMQPHMRGMCGCQKYFPQPAVPGGVWTCTR